MGVQVASMMGAPQKTDVLRVLGPRNGVNPVVSFCPPRGPISIAAHRGNYGIWGRRIFLLSQISGTMSTAILVLRSKKLGGRLTS